MTDKTMDIPVVQVTTVGTGDGGLQRNTSAQTPSGMPNVFVTVVGPAKAIAVRFVHTFFLTFSGMIGANAVGVSVLLVPDLQHAAYASLTVAAVGLIKDLVTVFGNLEGKFPLLTGNI